VGLHLSRSGFTVRLVTDASDEVTAVDVGAQSFESVLMDVLAEQTMSTGMSVQPGTTALRRGGGEELFVAIVAPMSLPDAQQLARAIHHGSCVGVALALDTATWTTLSPRAESDAARTFKDNCDVLAGAGWRVIPVRRGASLADLWPGAGAGLEAATGRQAADLRRAAAGA
jgi:hypothetical protein